MNHLDKASVSSKNSYTYKFQSFWVLPLTASLFRLPKHGSVINTFQYELI
jgi:hypothetical protein